ncbi:hypothetical protein [Nocardia sp. alder85J]|uniref:hypothetical protein n=1 Tax=Nocardia sp. alder85J TaxID=2862949 RepID=UPI001CD2083A|nr:hypothetical protein [Nocardia sp. alder85J]MCX4094831.1 hypothetical protein [Nocardia sp. alder85J]
MTNSTFRITPELPAWVWALPPATLLDLFDADVAQSAHTRSMQDYYWLQLRQMALHLIVDAPAPPATCTAEFLSRFDPYTLAGLWGGNTYSNTWTGAPGVDRQIAALLDGPQPILSGLLAEFTNRFRLWAVLPDQLHAAVRAVHPDFVFPAIDEEY